MKEMKNTGVAGAGAAAARSARGGGDGRGKEVVVLKIVNGRGHAVCALVRV